jgi:acetolactate synthase-1/2/3 large subunit
METAARIFAGILRRHGTDRVFSVAGESYLALLDELHDDPAIDVVTDRHEGSAGFAALADAKATGRAGVCLVSRGPGATNASIAVHAAAEDATPMLLVVGQVPLTDLGHDAFQEIDCQQTFGDTAKGVWTIVDPTRTAETLHRALRLAESGTPGPVVVVVPEDVWTMTTPPPIARPVARHSDGIADAGDIDALDDLLRGAARPLLIAGNRLRGDLGRALLKAVSERHRLPVVCSNKGQDLFDNRHPHYAGHLHNNTQSAQQALFGEADLVLAVGTRLDATTTLGGRLPAASQPLVHVYPDAAQLGIRHHGIREIACDPVEFLHQLAELSPAGHQPARQSWITELHRTEAAKAEWQPHDSDDGIAFGAVIAELDDLTGGDVIVAVDSGTFTGWTYRYLRLTGEGRLFGIASSAMGFGVPAGVALALRLRRPVVVIVGDGGFQMTGSELATAVARRLPLVVVIANNGSFATIRAHQERHYPGRVTATDLDNPDFMALAAAYGCMGLRVDEPEDIRPSLSKALACGGPAVIDVRTSLSWISAYRRIALPGACP